MKNLRWALPIAALAGLLSSGCVLTSAQVMATYDLPNPLTIVNTSTLQHVDVDLNEVQDYRDHKDKLKDVVDLAFLGRFVNRAGSPALGVSVYITPGITDHPDQASVISDPAAVRVWGPLDLPAGTSTTDIGWDRSAALFGAGKSALIDEIKGDGRFSLYLVSSMGTHSVEIRNGALVLVLAGGL